MQNCSRTQEFTQNSRTSTKTCLSCLYPDVSEIALLRFNLPVARYGKNYQYPGNAWDPIYNNFDHRDRFLQITPNWVCIEYASVCAFAYVHWMHNRLWSWRCWKAGDKCRNRFIQVTNTSCWRDTLALCIREKTQTSLKIHSYHMTFTFLLSHRGTYVNHVCIFLGLPPPLYANVISERFPRRKKSRKQKTVF